MVTDEEFLKASEKKKTNKPATNPPKKAKMETGEKNFKEKLASGKNPQMMEPKVAPDEIPRIPESARGFLKKPWNTAPLPPSKAPQIRHKRILGKRISKIIINSIPSFPDFKRLFNEIFSAPKKTEESVTKIKMAARTDVPIIDFDFINLNHQLI